jgi:hypothetical protein
MTPRLQPTSLRVAPFASTPQSFCSSLLGSVAQAFLFILPAPQARPVPPAPKARLVPPVPSVVEGREVEGIAVIGQPASWLSLLRNSQLYFYNFLTP